MHRRYFHSFPALLLAATICASCTSSREGESAGQRASKLRVPVESLDSVLDAVDPHVLIGPTPQLPNPVWTFSMVASTVGAANSPQMRALHSIRRVVFEIRDDDSALVDSLATTDVVFSGVQNQGGSASITASAHVKWPGDPGERWTLTMLMYSPSGEVARRVPFGLDRSGSGSMSMHVDVRRTAGGAQFTIDAQRIGRAPDGEYLEGSDPVVVEIQSGIGESLWSSGFGLDRQNHGVVQPHDAGSEKQFVVYWDGRNDITGLPLAPGTYRLVVTIPAHPEHYVLREDFYWTGQ